MKPLFSKTMVTFDHDSNKNKSDTLLIMFLARYTKVSFQVLNIVHKNVL